MQRSMFTLFSLAGALSISACVNEEPRDEVPTVLSAPTSQGAATGAPMAVREAASHALVDQVATALRDPAQRMELVAALRASPVKEGKLHLRTHLMGAGSALREATERSAKRTGQDVASLLDQAGSLEVYLPVAEHRKLWQGGEDLIVASQLDDMVGDIYAVGLDGKQVRLSADAPPATPVLALVPAESFLSNGAPLARDLAGGTSAASLLAYTGLWVNEVHVGDLGSYEGWLMGDPEVELHVQNASNRATITCADANQSVEPFAFNMDSNDYLRPFLIINENSVGVGTSMVLALYEDDDTGCVIKTSGDQIKAISDALYHAANIGRAILTRSSINGQLLYSIRNLIIALKSVFSGGDDLIGVSAGFTDIASTPTAMFLKNTNMVNTGSLVLQRKTDVAH
jgi:hypothetical protein